MDKNELNKLINSLVNNSKTDKNDLKNKEKAQELLKNLDKNQTERLGAILSDPEKSRAVLNSPAAQALMKKLMK